MRFSLTVVFFFLFLLVVAAYVYLVPPAPKPSPDKEPLNARLLNLEDSDEITVLAVEDQVHGEKLRFVRREGRWFLEEPLKGPADKLLVEGLAAALTLSAKARRLMPEGGWSEYGLDDPKVRVGISTKRRPEVRTLLFGDSSPVGDFVFARWEGENDYFLLDPNLMKSFQRSAYSFREKKIFQRPLKGLSRVKIQNDSEVYEINRQESGWVWAEPIDLIGRPVSADAADLALGLLRGLFIKDFLGEEMQNTDKGFGLLSPETRIEMGGIGSADDHEVLQLGDELPVRDAFYARKEGESEVFLVARDKVGEIFAFFRGLTEAEFKKRKVNLPETAAA